MSAKQSRIEKLKLEIRKLEAERDGLKQVRTEGIDVDETVSVCNSVFTNRLHRVHPGCLSTAAYSPHALPQLTISEDLATHGAPLFALCV